ncbi:Uncharacterised protein [Mycobacteroides abscessus subsp. abscessus]|nr:Uncharacterised protein [Mycobacteroides abscessus subsp. abscessus]
MIASAAPRFPGPRANPASSRAVGRRCQHNGAPSTIAAARIRTPPATPSGPHTTLAHM